MAELRTLETRRDREQRSVIETLEEMLEEARAGQIVAVATAIVRPDSAMNTAWSEGDNATMLCGAVALLQNRLFRHLDGD